MTNGNENRDITRHIPVERLLLDAANPRLPEQLDITDQDELVEFVAEEYDALKIAESFARYGYFPSEPLIVVVEDDDHVVVEGNRRLAALKLLLDEDLRGRLDLEEIEEWNRLAGEAALSDLETVPVDIRGSRDEVAPVLGYRHISGIEPWDPWAKARFIANLIEAHDRDFEETAALVGERETDVRSHYRNYRIVHQAQEEFGYDTELVRSNFGTFTRAMQSRDLRDFIGAPPPRDTETSEHPVPEERREELGELLEWLFGPTGRVITESRDITELATVVQSDDALEVLRDSGDLEEAFATAGGVLDRLLNRLTNARNNLLHAREDLATYAGNKEVQRRLEECAEALGRLREG